MRIVHFSDLHIGGNVSRYVAPTVNGYAAVEYDSLSALARAGNRTRISRTASVKSDGAPVCIVSGDLSASGDPQELSNAFTFLESKLVCSIGAPRVGLEYGNKSLNLILGNHDIWGGKSSLLAWIAADKKKQQASALFNNHDGMSRWTVNTKRIQNYCDIGELRIRAYMLDSTLPGLMNVFARGRVASSDLNELRKAVHQDQESDMEEPSIRNSLRIAVLHHPIETATKYRISMLLENAEEVKEALKDLNFGMVLAGHVHERDIREIAPGLHQCISGSSSQTEHDRLSELSFLVYDITPGSETGGNHCTAAITQYVRSGNQGVPFAAKPTKIINPQVVVLK